MQLSVIDFSFDSGYAAKGVNYSKKSSMNLTPEAYFIKSFFGVIYAISDLTWVKTKVKCG